MPDLNPDDFGDNQAPQAVGDDPEQKAFRVQLANGSEVKIKAFRLFTAFDANLGLVVRALRANDTEVGVFYAPLGWYLIDPQKWTTP